MILLGAELGDRLKAAFGEVTVFDVEDRLKEIQVPTLDMEGRKDLIVPVEESMAIHDRIPNLSMLVL